MIILEAVGNPSGMTIKGGMLYKFNIAYTGWRNSWLHISA